MDRELVPLVLDTYDRVVVGLKVLANNVHGVRVCIAQESLELLVDLALPLIDSHVRVRIHAETSGATRRSYQLREQEEL